MALGGSVRVSSGGPGERWAIYLASQSPRRRSLLAEAGIAFEVVEPGLDDAELEQGAGSTPEQWVGSLAYLKARATRARLGASARGLVIGADTMVVHRGRLVGKPFNADDAARMIRELSNDEHSVVTGVALLDAASARRELLVDAAVVRVGAIDDSEVARYVASAQWRGKAGGYNLSERVAAGWPITWVGDPGTIMGLPMRRLLPRLGAWRAAGAEVGA
jgi:septum formation protein